MANKQQLQSAGDGTAIPAGYVGEVIETASFSDYTCTTSEENITGASITLGSGVWRIFYSLSVNATTGAVAGNITSVDVLLTNSSNTKIGNSQKKLYANNTGSGNYVLISTLTAEAIVSISTSTIYKLRAFRTDSNGTGSGSVYGTSSTLGNATFHAIRIA